MTPSATSFNELWREITRRQPSSSSWPSALRRGGLVGLIAIVGALTGEYAIFAVVAVGALNIGLVDAAVPKATLTKALGFVSILGSVIASISAFLAGTWWSVLLLFVLAFVMGSYSGRGLVAFNTTFMSLVIAVIFTNDPGNLGNAARLGALVLIGSLLQMAISLIAWRYEREATIRRSIGLAIEELNTAVRSVGSHLEEDRRRMSATVFIRNAESSLAAARLPAQRYAMYADVIRQLTWTRISILAWLAVGYPTANERDEVTNKLLLINGLIRASPKRHRHEVPTESRDPSWLDVMDQLARLQESSQVLHDTKFAVSSTSEPMPDALSLEPTFSLEHVQLLLRGLLPGSPTFRHAVRLSCAVSVAEIIVLISNLDRGYWVPLTVVMIVKPDFKTTVTRGALRIVGTIAAMVLIGTLLTATDYSTTVMAFVVLIFAPLTMRWMTANYALAAFAISSTVLSLIEAGNAEGATVLLRVQNTLIGVAIGLIAYAAIPSWTTDRVGSLLETVLARQRSWMKLLLAANNPSPSELTTIRLAGRDVRTASLEAGPHLEAAAIEPHRTHLDPIVALEVLDACQRVGAAGLALEMQLRDDPACLTRIDAAITGKIDADLASSEDRFRSTDHTTDVAIAPIDADTRARIESISDLRLRRAVDLLVVNANATSTLTHTVYGD